MMQGKLTQRRIGFGLVAAMMAGAIVVAPVQAQTPTGTSSGGGGAMKMIVVDLENKADAKAARFGQRTAEEVRKGISQMATHSAVPAKDVDAELKRLNVPKADFSCITAQQLAQRLSVQLVMCGEYTPADAGTSVSVSFYGKTAEGETIQYDVPPFTAANEKDAAAKIVQEFTGYTRQLSLVQYCVNYVGSENWTSALDLCTQSLQINPKSAPSAYGRAAALNGLERYEEALAGFRQTLDMQPTNQNAMLSAGIVAAKLGQTETSQKYFKDYLDMNPGDTQVRLKIAVDLNTAGDPAGSVRILEEGLAADTGNYEMMRNIGTFAILAAVKASQASGPAGDATDAKAMYTKALGYFERVNASAPKLVTDDMLYYMILGYQQTAQLDKAVATGAMATGRDSASAKTWQAYGSALGASGKATEAAAALARAAQIDPTMKVSYQLAIIAANAGNVDDVVTYGQKALAEGTAPAQVEQLAVMLAGKVGSPGTELEFAL